MLGYRLISVISVTERLLKEYLVLFEIFVLQLIISRKILATTKISQSYLVDQNGLRKKKYFKTFNTSHPSRL